MLRPNQVYKLTVRTPNGVYEYKFVTEVEPLYSTYEQLLADTGLTEDDLEYAKGLRFLHQASLICRDIVEHNGNQVPKEPTFVMQQYVRYRAARDVVMSGLRSATYGGRGTVQQRLADLSIERRPQPLMEEIRSTLRNFERELAYWESRLKGRPPVTFAVRAGRSCPYPFDPRV